MTPRKCSVGERVFSMSHSYMYDYYDVTRNLTLYQKSIPSSAITITFDFGPKELKLTIPIFDEWSQLDI